MFSYKELTNFLVDNPEHVSTKTLKKAIEKLPSSYLGNLTHNIGVSFSVTFTPRWRESPTLKPEYANQNIVP